MVLLHVEIPPFLISNTVYILKCTSNVHVMLDSGNANILPVQNHKLSLSLCEIIGMCYDDNSSSSLLLFEALCLSTVVVLEPSEGLLSCSELLSMVNYYWSGWGRVVWTKIGQPRSGSSGKKNWCSLWGGASDVCVAWLSAPHTIALIHIFRQSKRKRTAPYSVTDWTVNRSIQHKATGRNNDCLNVCFFSVFFTIVVLLCIVLWPQIRQF